jgi:hypothetical protein
MTVVLYPWNCCYFPNCWKGVPLPLSTLSKYPKDNSCNNLCKLLATQNWLNLIKHRINAVHEPLDLLGRVTH